MFELVNKKRNNLKKNKKGFTLVEVIVVLVILAILAAILVPAMIGWINKANEKTAVVEGRNVLLALQTVASDTYNPSNGTTGLKDGKLVDQASTIKDDVDELTEIDNVSAGDTVTNIKVIKGKVTEFQYKSDNFTVTYNSNSKADKKFTVAKN